MSIRVISNVSNDEKRIFNNVGTISSATTLTAADSGKWYKLNNATGVTVTLPALKSGVNFKFIVAAAFATSNFIIDSAEGDNIEGVLVVNGASVVASGEDQINFVNTAESAGDTVTLRSNGTNWYISAATASSSGAITCTDPS